MKHASETPPTTPAPITCAGSQTQSRCHHWNAARHECLHPQNMGVCLVTGKTIAVFFPSMVRYFEHKCGPGAAWYTPAEPF